MSMSNYSCEGECRAKAKTASVEKSDVEPLQFYIQVYIFDKFFFHESFKYLVPWVQTCPEYLPTRPQLCQSL